MPYLPDLTEGTQSRAVIDVFGGYNHNLKISEGEWYEEKNLTSDHYPMFSQRRARSKYGSASGEIQGMIARDALAWVDGGKLWYNGGIVDGVTLSEDEADNPKQLVSMGAYLCIFPDGVYVNTADLTDYGSMAAAYAPVDGLTVSFTPCRQTGEEYPDEDLFISDTEPEEPENGQYWLDTSKDTHELKQYSSTSGMWVQIPTVYTKISCAGIGKLFRQYDGVTISGISYDVEEGDAKLAEQLEALNTTAVIQSLGDDFIVIIGLIDRAYIQENGNIRVERKVPKMQYVCEANNRLWGCFYGMHDGEMLNEIYACKQGDFKNWNCFMGLSTDSYSASVGTDGEFTGCIAYLSNPLFFKENCIHRLSGSMPSNYQLATTTCRGVQRGSWRSLVVVNETLYYKSRSDVCAYDGSLPVGVSSQFGTGLYSEAAAGAHGGKYFISMRDGDGEWHLFVYDTQRSIWHHEDNAHATCFAAWGDEIFFSVGSDIYAINGTVGTNEGSVEWSATSGLIGYELVDHQYVSRFNFRMKLGVGARCALSIEYDSDGIWIYQGEIVGRATDSFVIPVIPQRCDHFRVRLSGVGDIKIYSIAKMIEQGSDA